jgi:hypothetical protein
MAKIKYGKITIDPNEFDEATASIRISMMLPMKMYKALKSLSLNEAHEGKYQVLIKDILAQYILRQRLSKTASPVARYVTVESAPNIKTNKKSKVSLSKEVDISDDDEEFFPAERHAYARK